MTYIPKHKVHCQALFEELALNDPGALLTLLKPEAGLKVSDLTFAAEIAGRALPTELVESLWLDLLKHECPAVREGALYGLDNHPTSAVREAVRRMAFVDPSPAIRSVAVE